MRTITPITGLLLMILPTVMLGQQNGSQAMPRTASPPGAAVYIISPQAGEHVTSPVTVKFGLTGMGVAPAGSENPNTGHHHLLIDVAELPPENQPLPATDQIRHFGGGQTETTLELAPGRHTLQLVFADGKHVAHNPPVRSDKITITVVEN